MKKYSFTAELGWSFSRYNMFTECKRRYYYHYYSKYDKDSQTIQNLKSMTSYALELGSVVHDLIRDSLNELKHTGKMTSFDNLMSNYNNKYKGQIMVKSFVEVHNKIYKEINFGRFDNEVSKATKNFIDSDRVKFLLNNQDKSNLWEIEASGYGETRIANMKAYCKTDFIVFDNKGNCIILDWKTGKKNGKHSEQLHSYASWVSNELNELNELNIPLSGIQTIVAYLLPDYSEDEPVTYKDDEYEEFVKKVREQTDEMKSYLIDVTNNIPKDKEEFEKNYDDRRCKYCNYYSLCK